MNKKIIDCMTFKIPAFDKADVERMNDFMANGANGGKLIVKVVANESGKIVNNRVYPGLDLMRGYAKWTGRSFRTKVLRFHRSGDFLGPSAEDPIGFVLDAEFKPMKKGKEFKEDYKNPVVGYEEHGSGVGILTLAITDPDAIQKFLDGRYDAVSTGAVIDRLVCSICGSDLYAGECSHVPGRYYTISDDPNSSEERLCYGISQGWTPLEVSVVNVPALGTTKVLSINSDSTEDSVDIVEGEAKAEFILVNDALEDALVIDGEGHMKKVVKTDISIDFDDIKKDKEEDNVDISTTTDTSATDTGVDEKKDSTNKADVKDVEDSADTDKEKDEDTVVDTKEVKDETKDETEEKSEKDTKEVDVEDTDETDKDEVDKQDATDNKDEVDKNTEDSTEGDVGSDDTTIDNTGDSSDKETEPDTKDNTEDKLGDKEDTPADNTTTDNQDDTLPGGFVSYDEFALAHVVHSICKDELNNIGDPEEGIEDEYSIEDYWLLHDKFEDFLIDLGSGTIEDAKLSAKQRKALKKSQFCGPNRSFPVPDCAHVTAARRLLGRYKGPGDKNKIRACIERKAKALGCDKKKKGSDSYEDLLFKYEDLCEKFTNMSTQFDNLKAKYEKDVDALNIRLDDTKRSYDDVCKLLEEAKKVQFKLARSLFIFTNQDANIGDVRTFIDKASLDELLAKVLTDKLEEHVNRVLDVVNRPGSTEDDVKEEEVDRDVYWHTKYFS